MLIPQGKGNGSILRSIKYEERTEAYTWLGKKYHSRWGSAIMEYFAEKAIKEEVLEWSSRYHLFAKLLCRAMPHSSLCITLEKMERDKLLEHRLERGIHHYRIRPLTMAMLVAIAQDGRQE
ncbi:MAG: hypothetical protein QCI38_01255 [Candidatus Thermoplasmatota archaeon]|nr:hypothetical protein [Candidatus Thermoplasmatota archaeon]